MQLEYLNPLIGLGMLIAGLFVISFGFFYYGIMPAAAGLFLIAYYRKHLFQLMGLN